MIWFQNVAQADEQKHILRPQQHHRPFRKLSQRVNSSKDFISFIHRQQARFPGGMDAWGGGDTGLVVLACGSVWGPGVHD